MKRKKGWIIGIVIILVLGGYYLSQSHSHESNNTTEIRADEPDRDTGTSFTETVEAARETAKPQTEETATEPKTEETIVETASDPGNFTEAEEGLRDDFKAAMDSYEAFMNEYCDFMKKYKDNPADAGLIADYASYTAKYADFVNKFSKWESEDLNDTETAYYIEVQTRVNNRLTEAALQ